jgi:hypothetical protein
MGYTVLGERDAKWQPRKGLEGPFTLLQVVCYTTMSEKVSTMTLLRTST